MRGFGHRVGSRIVSNEETSLQLGLPADWLFDRTGIRERRLCGPGEDVLVLGKSAVESALQDAGLRPDELGKETVLLHIQNGLTHLTPPAAIVLAGSLGLKHVRCLSIDGVCAEPINALEIAALMFNAGTCERVIISAAVDFTGLIDSADKQTAGLFGCGAGAVVLERGGDDCKSRLLGLDWETHSEHWELGLSPLLDTEQVSKGVRVTFGHYQMRGQELARIAVRVLGGVLQTTLRNADCLLNECGLVISHQPNVKMLEIGLTRLGISLERAPKPGAWMGNLGPASLLVGLSLANEAGLVKSGQRILFLSFGLGFSAGAAILKI